MSADRKFPGQPKGLHSVLNEMLDFGPTESPTDQANPMPPVTADFTARLKKILRQIQEISRRIDDLSERF